MRDGDGYLCSSCREERRKTEKQQEIILRSQAIHEPKDLSGWSGRDMSELFWITLGEYTKEPTEARLSLMRTIYYWACHANHTLLNSMVHALNWANVSLFKD